MGAQIAVLFLVLAELMAAVLFNFFALFIKSCVLALLNLVIWTTVRGDFWN